MDQLFSGHYAPTIFPPIKKQNKEKPGYPLQSLRHVYLWSQSFVIQYAANESCWNPPAIIHIDLLHHESVPYFPNESETFPSEKKKEESDVLAEDEEKKGGGRESVPVDQFGAVKLNRMRDDMRIRALAAAW
ncbi:hypothetical protein OUZ56_014721 [Daphnia magna]|uniref:Uncharacterized protein n=1 Tax=Daphnia magna TaxID=35525 RepID=A0ABR0AKM1_9CRUS|nr:hypothetical protein OUZ56_014721 [Daphnia magna]